MGNYTQSNLTQFIVSFLLERSSPALFAGAGVGAKAGLPTWRRFLEHLANVADDHEPLVAQLIRSRVERGDYVSAATAFKTSTEIPAGERLAQIVAPFDAPPKPMTLNPLLSLPFATVFTTNFDRSLLDSHAAVFKRAPIAVELGDLSMRRAAFIAKRFIARLHGRIEVPESIVLDEADYLRVDQDPHYLDLLGAALTRYSCLFIGFSFMDPAITHVLQLIEERYGPALPTVHAAILPANADPALSARLSKYNIQVVHYDEIGNHSVLWSSISEAASEIAATRVKIVSAPRPYKTIRRYLGAAYASAKLGTEIEPLKDMVLDGMITRILLDTPDHNLMYTEIATQLSGELAISKDESVDLLEGRLRVLLVRGVCTQHDRRITLAKGITDHISGDLSILTEGVLNRMRLREGIRISEDRYLVVSNALEQTLIAHSWDLGAHYAGSDTVTDPPNIQATAFSILKRLDPEMDLRQKTAMGLSINDLFQNPDDTESRLLAELGRIAFALQLVVNAPVSTLIHRTMLPDILYLDANILMPAMLNGHPYYPVYNDALLRLVAASRSVGRPVEVRVGRSFINEVLAHKELAEREVEVLGLEDPDELEQFVMYYGVVNMNVFIGAYSAWVGRKKTRIPFAEFLLENAPYKDEIEVESYLQNLGARVVDLIPRTGERGQLFGRIRTALYEVYEADQYPGGEQKRSVLIEHEARQLTRLQIDAESNKSSFFVSADLQLRRVATGEVLSYPGQFIITNRAFVQMVDLLIGMRTDPRSLARLLWSRSPSESEMMLRNYFISRALKSFDHAQILAVSEILDSIVEDASRSAIEERVFLFPGGSPESKAHTAAFLDRFEDRFYKYMSEAIDRRSDRVDET